MKKIIVTLLFIFMFIALLSPALAIEREDDDDDSRDKLKNIKEKVQNILETRKPDKISSKTGNLNNSTASAKKEEDKKRIRNSITVRWNAYSKLLTRSGQLLDKLQIRIDKAKTAGKDTTEVVNAMTDARAKLADAKSKMETLKGLLGTDLDKNGFKEAQKNLQAVHKDLNIVKQDASKIIRNLKSFNSEKDSTKSGEASKSAKDRD
jgi:hypothetical protein